jgi:hypothetical protein
MSAARIRLVSKQTFRQAGETSGTNFTRISQADTVLQFAPELADEVLSGATPLDKAYATARKQAASGTEAKMARLQACAWA